jgi:type I restriction enzyme M protein
MPLLDEYDVYEQLMTYWHDTMHDDIFLIMNDGWLGAAKPRIAIEDKDRKLTEAPDLVTGSGKSGTKYKMDLLSPGLLAGRYFRAEQNRVAELESVAEEATRVVEEFTEEHAVEEGLLSEAMDDGKLTKALTANRLKEAKREGSDPDEVKALERMLDLYREETKAKQMAKDARSTLDLLVLKRYGTLSEGEIREMILGDKWLSSIATRVNNEVTALTLALVIRLHQLGERYGETLGAIDHALEQAEDLVRKHLAEMGLT